MKVRASRTYLILEEHKKDPQRTAKQISYSVGLPSSVVYKTLKRHSRQFKNKEHPNAIEWTPEMAAVLLDGVRGNIPIRFLEKKIGVYRSSMVQPLMEMLRERL